MVSLQEVVLLWRKTPRVHSKLLTMKDVLLIQAFSLVLYPMEMHCNRCTKHLDLPNLMGSSSNAMLNTVLGLVKQYV